MSSSPLSSGIALAPAASPNAPASPGHHLAQALAALHTRQPLTPEGRQAVCALRMATTGLPPLRGMAVPEIAARLDPELPLTTVERARYAQAAALQLALERDALYLLPAIAEPSLQQVAQREADLRDRHAAERTALAQGFITLEECRKHLATATLELDPRSPSTVPPERLRHLQQLGLQPPAAPFSLPCWQDWSNRTLGGAERALAQRMAAFVGTELERLRLAWLAAMGSLLARQAQQLTPEVARTHEDAELQRALQGCAQSPFLTRWPLAPGWADLGVRGMRQDALSAQDTGMPDAPSVEERASACLLRVGRLLPQPLGEAPAFTRADAAALLGEPAPEPPRQALFLQCGAVQERLQLDARGAVEVAGPDLARGPMELLLRRGLARLEDFRHAGEAAGLCLARQDRLEELLRALARRLALAADWDEQGVRVPEDMGALVAALADWGIEIPARVDLAALYGAVARRLESVEEELAACYVLTLGSALDWSRASWLGAAGALLSQCASECLKQTGAEGQEPDEALRRGLLRCEELPLGAPWPRGE